MGHPYIASLWLGFQFVKNVPKRVLCHSLALFCLLPGYFQAFGFWLTKGFKVPFVILHAAPILVFEWGQCYTRHFVLYIMDPVQIITNIRKSQLLHRFASKCYISNLQYIANKCVFIEYGVKPFNYL